MESNLFDPPKSFKVLILGASYGSLLASKLLLAGHQVTLVCRSQTADLINREGTRVKMTVKGTSELIEIDSRLYPNALNAMAPDQVHPEHYDLVGLAMQEPQYSETSVRALMKRIGKANVPCMSIMNMPPLPYLARINGMDIRNYRSCYLDPEVWDGFDPSLMTLCSPDPQAFRPIPDQPNVLQVGLPTNFKVAKFVHSEQNAVLEQLESDIEKARFMQDGVALDLPVKLKVHDSLFVPLAKWSMLLTGNYRCILDETVQSIKEAVHSDIDQSRAIYEWVAHLCKILGASHDDMVPFEKYANAANGLLKPSSAARSLVAGETHIERIDLLIKLIADQKGYQLDSVDVTVKRVDHWLNKNRAQHQKTAQLQAS
ncbi:MAG: 2-dehydropantoate 2-reductase N-terminal domain-containing protein [Betaproteobacteria bacterium]|jgi:Ketopantoate reductase PanE/ApbA